MCLKPRGMRICKMLLVVYVALSSQPKGAHSITDEMANSDLDGDAYWVCWNSKLVHAFTPSEPWQPSSELTPDAPSRPADSNEFERQYFEKCLKVSFDPSFVMGQAANNWLAFMDRYIMDCHEVIDEKKKMMMLPINRLVDIYYKALDADKSGLDEEVQFLAVLKLFDINIAVKKLVLKREKKRS